MGRMDDVGKQIDELEKSIEELMDQAGLDRSSIPNNKSLNNPDASAVATQRQCSAPVARSTRMSFLPSPSPPRTNLGKPTVPSSKVQKAKTAKNPFTAEI